jgi:hypothetical protein
MASLGSYCSNCVGHEIVVAAQTSDAWPILARCGDER